MSIQINIGLADDNVSTDALDRHMAALGFSRSAAMAIAAEAGASLPAASGTVVTNTARAGETEAQTAARKPRGGKKDAAPAISTSPEDRKPPEDDAETVAQDAADEAAEVEATRDPVKPLTVDDVKGAVGGYVEAHGMPATQEDGPAIFVSALGPPPAGEPFWRMSLLAGATQDQLGKAVVAWKTAAAAGQRFVAKGA